MPENYPETATLIVSIDGEQLSFTLPAEAIIGAERDMDAILSAMIDQLSEDDDAMREHLIRKYITDWSEPDEDEADI